MIAGAALPLHDEWLFGWDPTPGIVSVWADRDGCARIWLRSGAGLLCTEERFRPWLFAAHLDDLRHVGPAQVADGDANSDAAPLSYRALDGPPGTLRYLLSARDGRVLQQALLQGARRRLGPSVRSLRELPDYYMVGAVEQYLMASGRVQFRTLDYAALHRLQLDLETTALSPAEGRIFLVAVRDSRGLATILEAPTDRDEAALIADLCTLIRDRNPDVIENHNLFGFDLPYLVARAATLGVPLRLGRGDDAPLLERHDEPGGWGRGRRVRYSIVGRELIDTLDAVRRHDFVVRDMPGHGLKAAARYFGVAASDRTHIAGPEIYRTYLRDPDRVCRYALDDVSEVDGLSQQLLGAAFALAGMAPRRYERVAAAGPAMGILEPMLIRAYLRAGAALPAPQMDAAELPPHQGGAAILYAGGVARHVIKADIASMYPSIMRTFSIGPSCDRLGALLLLVDRLVQLRLVHKRLARAAPAQSADARQHDALQAAMKILINSAYGYMGAGRMAHFADRAAADEVTRRGREILGQVADLLRERGMVLLEADTDGVFAATPAHWTEQDERTCVASVASTLPNGIALEYEGRYQAMLSHEVKNYALLTYDGELIVRGAALRSSRSEPFGERFLREALLCLLAGDVPGVQRVYQDTVSALRERRLAPADVAAVARLTKSSEEYARTRGRAREAAYEALLAAGRTTWSAGERVRFYRAADGRAVWLPDIPENDLARMDDPQAAAPATGVGPDYAVTHYLAVLQTSYVARLRKAFTAEDYAQLFRPSGQVGLFDRPTEHLLPRWIEASSSKLSLSRNG
jgi:DNA polymerase elongation subunit (family B)